jgi:hypothetical protein
LHPVCCYGRALTEAIGKFGLLSVFASAGGGYAYASMLIDAHSFTLALGAIITGMVGVGVAGYAINRRQTRNRR